MTYWRVQFPHRVEFNLLTRPSSKDQLHDIHTAWIVKHYPDIRHDPIHVPSATNKWYDCDWRIDSDTYGHYEVSFKDPTVAMHFKLVFAGQQC